MYLFWGSALLYLQSPKGGCCSISDDLTSRRRWLLPGTWSHLWFAGVREWPPWCSIVGATVAVHQFFCILHCPDVILGTHWCKLCTEHTLDFVCWKLQAQNHEDITWAFLYAWHILKCVWYTPVKYQTILPFICVLTKEMECVCYTSKNILTLEHVCIACIKITNTRY